MRRLRVKGARRVPGRAVPLHRGARRPHGHCVLPRRVPRVLAPVLRRGARRGRDAAAVLGIPRPRVPAHPEPLGALVHRAGQRRDRERPRRISSRAQALGEYLRRRVPAEVLVGRVLDYGGDRGQFIPPAVGATKYLYDVSGQPPVEGVVPVRDASDLKDLRAQSRARLSRARARGRARGVPGRPAAGAWAVGEGHWLYVEVPPSGTRSSSGGSARTGSDAPRRARRCAAGSRGWCATSTRPRCA